MEKCHPRNSDNELILLIYASRNLIGTDLTLVKTCKSLVGCSLFGLSAPFEVGQESGERKQATCMDGR